MVIEVWHDGYLWCAALGGDFIGRYTTYDAAFAAAYGEKCRIVGMQ